MSMNEEVTMNEPQQAVPQAEVKVKPLSDNPVLAFFQKIWRWWLGVWYGFADKHPKGSSIIYKVFFFVVFSYGVTIWQYLVMTFLPLAMKGLGTEPWGWPNVPLFEGSEAFIIFGDSRGLGYWLAFEIAVFTAQCINFPLQRNITYKSKGNPWFQAMWYFIGWIGVSILTGALWGLCNVFIQAWGWPDAVAGLVQTFITGGVSMIIFFFIFLVIFPDQQKMAAKAEKKVEELKVRGASAEEIAAAEAKAVVFREKAKLDTARKEEITARSTANAKAVSWEASCKLLEKMKAEGKPEEELTAQEQIVSEKYQIALEAAVKRDEAIAANQTAIREVEEARAARAVRAA